MTAELASPEGGYGGFEAVYDAVDPADGTSYRYTVVEEHGADGVHRSESLDRD